MGFTTEGDFEMVLGLPTGTRMEKKVKKMLIAEGIGILKAARDESQVVIIDDGPVDPAYPDGPHNTHTIPAVNPIWKQYGFESIEDSIAMLARFEAMVV
jgi:hypothetical protein